MPKSNGSGGARRVKKITKQSRADAAPAPRPSNRNNLGQFRPGHSGNPEGRPKGPSLLAALKHRLEANPEEVDQIVMVLVSMARAGDLKAVEIVADRLDGKPTQRSEISGPDGGPVINIIHADYEPEEANGDGDRTAVLRRLDER